MPKPLSAPFVPDDHDHQACLTGALQAAERICRRENRRFTDLRRKIFSLVWQQHKPVGAYQVLEMLQREGRAAPPTVYRALDFLQEMGLVHRIVSLNAYVGCTQPGRAHDGQFLICEACHALAELNTARVTSAVAETAHRLDFEVKRNMVEVLGLCPACRRSSRS